VNFYIIMLQYLVYLNIMVFVHRIYIWKVILCYPILHLSISSLEAQKGR